MRAALLLLALLWGELASLPARQVLAGPGDEQVEATGRRDGAVVVARLRGTDLFRPHPAQGGALHLLPPAPPVAPAAMGPPSGARFARPADLARALSVSARPRAPRAPPLARS